MAANIPHSRAKGQGGSLTLRTVALLWALAVACSAHSLVAAPSDALIADGTVVKLRLTQTITSTHAHRGDRLNLEVAKDVTVDGFTVIGAGTLARGSVVKVRGRRLLGLGGEVVVQPDSVQLASGDTVSLHGRREFNGGSHTKLMAEGMVIAALIFHPAAPALLLTHGHECVVLKGSELAATIEGDLRVPSAKLEPASPSGPGVSDLISMLPPRVTNGDGREGDMMNLLFVAREDDFRRAFADAGWVETDKMKPTLFWHLLCQRKHYSRLPMARLYAFGRRQDYSYSLPDPTGELTRRHHVRIWKTDYEVNGVPVWVGAATHDVALEFEKHHLWMTHRIDPDVDAERDFIAQDLKKTELVTHQEYIALAAPIIEARTTTGDPFHSDSRVLVLELSQTPALALAGIEPTVHTPR